MKGAEDGYKILSNRTWAKKRKIKSANVGSATDKGKIGLHVIFKVFVYQQPFQGNLEKMKESLGVGELITFSKYRPGSKKRMLS